MPPQVDGASNSSTTSPMAVPEPPDADRALSRDDLPPLGLLAGAIALFTWGWADYGWHLYLSLRLPVFDFGINYQAIWAAAHGTSIDFFTVGVGSLLLYVFVPVTWILRSPTTFFLFLLAFQAAWLAAGSIPLFLVARER